MKLDPPQRLPAVPPATLSLDDAMAQLERLKQLRDAGVLDEGEYGRLRGPLLDRIMGAA